MPRYGLTSEGNILNREQNFRVHVLLTHECMYSKEFILPTFCYVFNQSMHLNYTTEFQYCTTKLTENTW